jgi:hypothetical protein
MEKKTRLTVEIPADMYRYIKASAALQDMSIKDFVIDRLQNSQPKKSKKPNKTTLKVFADTDAGRGLSKVYTDQKQMWVDILG